MMGHEKPPLGLIPRFISVQCRIREILEAIDRYNAALKPIPIEWEEELADLLDWQRNEKLEENR